MIEAGAIVLFDSVTKSVVVKSNNVLGEVEATFFKEGARFGIEIKYNLLENEMASFIRMWGVEKCFVKYCNLDSPRLNKKKRKLEFELEVDFQKNEFTKGVFNCLKKFWPSFPSKLNITKG